MNRIPRRAAVVATLGAIMAASSGGAGAQTTTTTPGPSGVTTPGAEGAPGGQPLPQFRPIPAFPKAKFAPQGVQVKRLTSGVHMTKEELSPVRSFTGPTAMEAHPDNPRLIVAATGDQRTRLCRLLVSRDAGLTWTFSKENPSPAGYPFCTNTSSGVAQPQLAWGSDDTLYYAMQAYGEGEGPVAGNTSVALARTTDLGETWTTTIVTDARAQPDPKPRNTCCPGLAVDTSGAEDAIYVGYSRDWRTAPEGHPLRMKADVVVSVSTDGGRSFGEPIKLSDHSKLTMTVAGTSYPLHFQTAFSRPFLTARNGVVLAVGDGGPPADNQPPDEVYKGIFGEADPMMIARSTDQGRTWTVSELSSPVYTAAGSHTGMGWTPKGGGDGTFVLAYSATPGDTPSASRSDIVLRRSTDKGVTWTDPVAVNDGDPKEQYSHFYPQLDVAPNGRVDVIWQDNRGVTDYTVEVRHTFSTDGGQTWAPNMKITDQPINYLRGVGINSDVYQPPGVASTNSYAAIAWADGRLGDDETRTQDNFGVVAQFSPLPVEEANTGWKTLAAVLGGLVLAGIVLLAIQALRRPG